ncbi:MAG: hypothetical protein ACFFBD_14865 [Candidatus Hodarchaeota archaeon]
MKISPKVHLLIWCLGAIGGFFALIVTGEFIDGLAVLYISFLVSVALFLYIRHKEVLETSAPVYTILPFYLGLGAAILAGQTSFAEDVLSETIILDIRLYFNAFSLLFAAPFLALALIQLYRHYGTVFRVINILGRPHSAKSIGLAYSLLFSISIIIVGFSIRQIELSTIVFVIFVIGLYLNFYVFSRERRLQTRLIEVQPYRRSQTTKERRRTSASRPTRPPNTRAATTPPRRQSKRSSSSDVRVRVAPRTTRSSRPKTSRAQTQSTSPTGQHRQPVFSSQDLRQQKQKKRTSVRVVPGTIRSQTKQRSKSTQRRSPTQAKRDLQKYYPKGQNISEDDFKCIFCYEFPLGEEVIICPHCGRPAHKTEFVAWSQTSKLCSRCTQPITSRNQIRISDAEYAKVLKNFKNQN